MHLGALTDREFTVEFMRQLKKRAFRLSVDMQNFVRQVDTVTGAVRFRDVPAKREIISLVDAVKLDVVEAEILTGSRDLEEAAAIVEDWGSSETLVTRSDGLLPGIEGKPILKDMLTRALTAEPAGAIRRWERIWLGG